MKEENKIKKMELIREKLCNSCSIDELFNITLNYRIEVNELGEYEIYDFNSGRIILISQDIDFIVFLLRIF